VWDPNIHEYGRDPLDAIRPHRASLDSWLRAWVDGVDLWHDMFLKGAKSSDA
jgi:hypothetical protein